MNKGQPATIEQKLKAAHMLIEGASQGEAAEAINVTRTTINRWVNSDPEFLGILHEIRSSITKVVDHRMIGLADTAVSTLADVCENGSTDSARVAAAKEILARLIPVDDSENLPPTPRELLGDKYEDAIEAVAGVMNESANA